MEYPDAGRLVAGAGGVILSVQMTKMLTDWFAGHEIATAMAIFVNLGPPASRSRWWYGRSSAQPMA